MKNLRLRLTDFKNALKNHEHTSFDNIILCVIVFSAILNGFETDHELMLQWHWLFHMMDTTILWIFVLELMIKIWAQGSKPWRYFASGWNLFDFVIVAAGFIPIIIRYLHPESATDLHAMAALRIFRLARAVRVLRVLRLVTHLRELQILVETLVGSFRKLLYVGLLLVCLFYVYAVIGVFLFRDNDPEHFANLPCAHMTLFQCITGDGWSDIMNGELHPDQAAIANPNAPAPISYPFLAPLYFASFIIIGSYVLLNLVVGIIISAMEQASEEHDKERDMEIMASEQMQWQLLQEISKRLDGIELSLQKRSD